MFWFLSSVNVCCIVCAQSRGVRNLRALVNESRRDPLIPSLTPSLPSSSSNSATSSLKSSRNMNNNDNTNNNIVVSEAKFNLEQDYSDLKAKVRIKCNV